MRSNRIGSHRIASHRGGQGLWCDRALRLDAMRCLRKLPVIYIENVGNSVGNSISTDIGIGHVKVMVTSDTSWHLDTEDSAVEEDGAILYHLMPYLMLALHTRPLVLPIRIRLLVLLTRQHQRLRHLELQRWHRPTRFQVLTWWILTYWGGHNLALHSKGKYRLLWAMQGNRPSVACTVEF